MNLENKQIRSAILDVYQKALGQNIDSKTLYYLITTVQKGESSIENITNTLMQTQEYKDRILSMFNVLHYDIMGTTSTDEIFNTFFNSYKTTLITNETIIKYIEYQKSNIKDEQKETEVQQPVQQVEKQDASKEIVYQEPIIKYVPSKPILEIEKIQKFEKVFGRNMFIQEYFKYIVDDNNNRYTDLEAMLVAHRDQFNIIANVYKLFCNIILTEHMYMTEHLLSIDNDEYHKTVIDNIVNSESYKSYMIDTLQLYYKKLYDANMDDSDVQYLFLQVQRQKLDPHNEKIIDILKDFKAQTDDFIEHIFKVYQRVMERQPDIYEIELCLVDYRKASRVQTIDVTDDELSKNLAKTLEFHDIIKKHIKILYYSQYNKDIPPSKLFSTLQSILQKTNITIDNLDSNIIQHFT